MTLKLIFFILYALAVTVVAAMYYRFTKNAAVPALTVISLILCGIITLSINWG